MSKFSALNNLLPGLIEDIDIYKIKHSQNLLRSPQSIEDLTISIRQRGLLQPILVRAKDSYYEIVAGNRRYQACKGLHNDDDKYFNG
jgi:ParB family chromosome partitioning protein